MRLLTLLSGVGADGAEREGELGEAVCTCATSGPPLKRKAQQGEQALPRLEFVFGGIHAALEDLLRRVMSPRATPSRPHDPPLAPLSLAQSSITSRLR
jgi:hypothetical protein